MVYFNLQPRATVDAVYNKNKGDSNEIEQVPKVKNMSLEYRMRYAPQRHPYGDLSSNEERRYRCDKDNFSHDAFPPMNIVHEISHQLPLWMGLLTKPLGPQKP